jgi:hypothetical protein
MAGLPPERISRFLTYLLRHQPKEYPLVFDKRGFVDWQDVVNLVQERYYDVTEEQVEAVVSRSEKKRFELVEGKVRATYGHSFAVELGAAAQQAPEKLYYGAARDLAQSMLRSGLKPRGGGGLCRAPPRSSAVADRDRCRRGAARRRAVLSIRAALSGRIHPGEVFILGLTACPTARSACHKRCCSDLYERLPVRDWTAGAAHAHG